MDLVNISYGWVSYLKATPETRARMAVRLQICDGCPNKQQVDKFTSRVLKLTGNQENNLFRCSLCKCPLGALAASPLNGCKGNKW